jgi:hypothetical protein
MNAENITQKLWSYCHVLLALVIETREIGSCYKSSVKHPDTDPPTAPAGS